MKIQYSKREEQTRKQQASKASVRDNRIIEDDHDEYGEFEPARKESHPERILRISRDLIAKYKQRFRMRERLEPKGVSRARG